MFRVLKVLLLAGVVFVFAGVAIADPPETIEVDGLTYTLLVIDGEVCYKDGEALYELDGDYYTYDSEGGQVMDAEVSFPE